MDDTNSWNECYIVCQIYDLLTEYHSDIHSQQRFVLKIYEMKNFERNVSIESSFALFVSSFSTCDCWRMLRSLFPIACWKKCNGVFGRAAKDVARRLACHLFPFPGVKHFSLENRGLRSGKRVYHINRTNVSRRNDPDFC